MENIQLSHTEFKKRQTNFLSNIILVLENLEHAENIGSAFRLADAFNIEEMIILNDKSLSFNQVRKTARSCEKTVKYRMVEDIEEAIIYVKHKGYSSIAL